MTVDLRLDVGSPFVKAAPGPVPLLTLKVIPRGSSDTVYIGKSPPGPEYFLIDSEARLALNGVDIPGGRLTQGPRFGDRASQMFHSETTWAFPMYAEVLRGIEDRRSDDVNVDFTLQLNFYRDSPEHGSSFQPAQASVQRKLSAKDWSEILESLGHDGAWIIELPIPSVGDLSEAKTYLDSARTKIGAHDGPGAVAELRKAWDCADRELAPMSKWRDEVVNGLSKGEADWPSKSDRVKQIQTAIDTFVQIGPHSDRYEVTPDDAIMAYRVTVSVMAYLSKKSNEGKARHS
jgi:hypothetical protein